MDVSDTQKINATDLERLLNQRATARQLEWPIQTYGAGSANSSTITTASTGSLGIGAVRFKEEGIVDGWLNGLPPMAQANAQGMVDYRDCVVQITTETKPLKVKMRTHMPQDPWAEAWERAAKREGIVPPDIAAKLPQAPAFEPERPKQTAPCMAVNDVSFIAERLKRLEAERAERVSK